jgi:plastocyanin
VRWAALGMVGAAALAVASAGGWTTTASAQEAEQRVLLYTGTTGYRHASAIDPGTPVLKAALEEAGYAVDVETCIDNGGAEGNCDHPDANPRVFTDENLAQYDAILLFNASSSWAGGDKPGPLWDEEQRGAIIRFVQAGGGIAANHNATDMGAGQVSWDWWDGGEQSAVGTLMKGHASTDLNNKADVEVADHQHLSTRDLPDTYEFGDEHYNFARSVRGTHHVLATLDERTYEPGSNAMGQDHPISWCKRYDGDAVEDGTGTPREYDDGRVWMTGMGHFGESYTADSELVRHIVGGVRWVAGEGRKSDCSGTVWSSFNRTILVNDINGPMGVDVAPDGKVYWTEIGPEQGYESEGYLKVHDPEGRANNKTTVATIPTRADHGNSEDGVLGMTLENGFDLTDPEKRDVYIYYSPRNPDWPTTGDQIVVGYNQISRFTLNADGTAVVPDSERVILRVPKAKISGEPSGFPGGPNDNGPGHVGGAGLDFDAEGNLYLGVGDDVSPNAPGHGRYTPMDFRAKERWDARKTAANTADLRGKVLRITPEDEIAADAEPGVDTTYTIPAGNMFAPGTAQTRPEIYAMGFRQPFTVHTDPAYPGHVVVGEYCHDNNANQADRAPAGVCEWNLVDEPSFNGWPFCMGDNAPINTTFRWNYATDTSTGLQYDCSLSSLPSDIRWAPEGETPVEPTFDGLDEIPGPARQATIWRKYPGQEGGQSPADFGDLSTGGMSPVTGPVYRYDAETAKPGAFPPYYDGSWLITNRGTNDGFWKEVKLREDDGQMLRVNDWVPPDAFGEPGTSFVIPSRFGPDGALYMARWSEGCCRNQIGEDTKTQLLKVEFTVTDECEADTEAPRVNHYLAGTEHETEPDTYVGSATLTVTAGDAGCSGVDTVETRVNGGDWERYSEPRTFDTPGTYSVEYRATDREGNVSDAETVAFTVEDDTPPDVREIFATGTTWDPDAIGVPFGATVTWRFDKPGESQPHDVWLVAPGTADPQNGAFQVTPGIVPAGGPPASYTFQQQGEWTFVCKVHATFNAAEQRWTGMVGTAEVGEGTDPGPGPGPDPDPGGTGQTPTPQPQPQPQPPAATPAPPAGEATKAKLAKLPAKRMRTFLRRGVRVRTACETGLTGRVRITLGRNAARKLRLGRRTIASARIRCGRDDRATVQLKPSRKVARVLRRARGSLRAKVTVSVGVGDVASSSSRRLVLTRR